MSFSFQAEDGQFVTSTGGNATPDARTTRFDGAPEASKGLVITPKAGDTDPRFFEVGDTYDLSWDGGNIADATVVRSDAVGEDGIVGFSGSDVNGEPALVLWTPDFDLQGWYESVGGRASFYTSDVQSSYTHSYVCFAAEALIETSTGPVMAGCLRVGQMVLTHDAELQPVRWVGRKRVPGLGHGAPVRLNRALRLSQQHRVMIVSARAEMLFGASEVLVPAKALVDGKNVCFEPCQHVDYVHVLLDRHHILSANGVACESLFLGPGAIPYLQAELPSELAAQVSHIRVARPVLTFKEAQLLLKQHTRLPERLSS